MNKFIEIYDSEFFIKELDVAWKATEKKCKDYSCDECSFYIFEEDICIGSLLGEAWRRMMNKKLDKNSN